MQKIRLIALDLDGTTLNDKSELMPRTKAILEWAISQGIYVVAASGRAFASFPKGVLAIRGLAYAVTSNGAAVCEPKSGERVFAFSLEPEKVDAILHFLEEEPEREIEVFYQGTAYVSDRFYADPVSCGASEKMVPYIRRTRHPVGDIRVFLREHRKGLDSFDIICSEPEKRMEWKTRLEELGGLYITSSVSYRIEVSNEKSGKGSALRKVAELLDVKPEEIIAFGNAENDLDMLAFAGISVAVANSEPAVLHAADRIAPSNEEEGVAQILEEMLGITYEEISAG